MSNKFMKILVNPKWESFILHVHKTPKNWYSLPVDTKIVCTSEMGDPMTESLTGGVCIGQITW